MILRSRTHRCIAKVSIFLIAIALIVVMAGCGTTNGTDTHPFAGGSGTAADPYQIENWTQLDAVRDYLGSHFILMNDLDSTTAGYSTLAGPAADGGKGWEPIGTVVLDVATLMEVMEDIMTTWVLPEDLLERVFPPESFVDPFTGNLDGQGFEIRDLFINRPLDLDPYMEELPETVEGGVGIFGLVAAGGVVENVGVIDADMTGGLGAGALAGVSAGTISNLSLIHI